MPDPSTTFVSWDPFVWFAEVARAAPPVPTTVALRLAAVGCDTVGVPAFAVLVAIVASDVFPVV